MLTLVRNTYTAAEDVAELLDSARFASQQAVEDYLLDRVLPAAYVRPPGTFQPQYTLDRAERALRYIAQRMNQDGARELAWWLLPRWTAAAPRIILTGLAFGSAFGLGIGLVLGLTAGLVVGLVAGFTAGLTAGLGIGLVVGLSHSEAWPTSLACLQLRLAHGTPLRMIKFLEDARARGAPASRGRRCLCQNAPFEW